MSVFDLYYQVNDTPEIQIIGHFDDLAAGVIKHRRFPDLSPMRSSLQRSPRNPGVARGSRLVLILLNHKGKQHHTSAFLTSEPGVSFQPAPLQKLHEPHWNGPLFDFE